MESVNILNKSGLLSKEDRKEPLFHRCRYLSFDSCLDLSKGVKVEAFGYGEKPFITMDQYSNDLASFIAWWTHFVKPGLNGFQGFGDIKFEIINFNTNFNLR